MMQLIDTIAEDTSHCKLLKDGTLVVNTIFYPQVKRILLEHNTSGTLYYADSDLDACNECDKNCNNCEYGDKK